jgi:3-phenylpropionate/trans-cinnamate dioxygenase ferredoxin reductase component
MSNSESQSFVVIGAGHAGGRAVEAMRANGFEGAIHLIGAEQMAPYERPPLSKEMLLDSGVDCPPMHPAEFYADKDITLHLGVTATDIDSDIRVVKNSDGTQLSYDRLLLCGGGRVRQLDVPGADLANIHTLRTVQDSSAIEALLAPGNSIVVVGGGFIGLEVASAAKSRGCAVTVVEATDRLMGRALPPEIGEAFAALHRDHGVDVRLNTGVEKFTGDTAVREVVTTSGDSLPADGVVVGIGVDPDVALAQTGNLEVNNGVVVDEFCRTSDPDIYAAGDVTFHFNPLLGRHVRLESWQNTQNQAIAAAANMCGANEAFAEIPWFWSDQFGVNLQMSGAPDVWDDIAIRGDLAERDGIIFQLNEGNLVGAISLNRPRDMRFVKRLMTAGKSPSRDTLIDEAITFRDLLKQ